MRPALTAGALVFVGSLGGVSAAPPVSAHLRVNLAGYLPEDRKVAVLFAEKPIKGWFTVRSGSSPEAVVRARIPGTSTGTWGRFPHHYPLDVSALRAPGQYVVEAAGASARFTIGPDALHEWPGYLLEYLRQQRCGYNPFLDTVCHPFDGRTAYGPLPAGTYVDARGGWHDAGDQLKYLITSSNATAQLLLAWQLRPAAFDDRVDRSAGSRATASPAASAKASSRATPTARPTATTRTPGPTTWSGARRAIQGHGRAPLSRRGRAVRTLDRRHVHGRTRHG